MNIDVSIIGFFLLTSLGIGFYYSRKVKSFQEYAIGSHAVSTRTLTASIMATCYGGASLSLGIENTYQSGLYFGLALVFGSFFSLLIGKIFVPRMQSFMVHMSLTETMNEWYGAKARLVTALFGLLRGIASLALEFNVLSKLISVFFDASGIWPTLIAAIVVIAYSSFGGIRAIVATDVLQCITFGLFVPMLFLFLCYNITHPIQKLHALFTEEAKFNLVSILRPNLQFVSLLFLIGSFMLPALLPAQVQRIYMAKNVLQAKKAFSYATYIALPLTILMVAIGALLFAENPHLLPNEVLPYLKHQFGFPGFSALFCIAVLALVMSTTDSDLHAASVLAAHDVYHVLNLKKTKPLTLVRLASIFLGISSLALSFAADDLLLLTLFGYAIWKPAFTIPVWMALFGFRTRPAMLFLSMATGLGTALSWDSWMRWLGVSVYIPGVVCGMLVNLCTLFLLHYMLPKLPHTGWVGIQNCTALEQQKQEIKRWFTHLGARLQALLSSSYWAGKLPREARHCFSLGLYLILISLVALWYMNRRYFMPYIYWYMGVMAAGALCFAYPTLLSYKKRGCHSVRMAWPIALYILLFVSGKAFMLLGDYKPIVCFLFALNIVIALVFLPRPIVLAMTALVMGIPNWLYGLPTVKSWELFFFNWKTDGTVSWVPLTILGYLFIVLHYRSRTQKLMQRLAQKELVQVSEHEALLEAIRHQKFYERQLPSGGGKALTNIEYELKAALKEQTLENVRKIITFELAKLKGFKDFLLTSVRD